MLRLIHKQTIAGAILVDDIDDGLPNKTSHRMGSTADPKAYRRDGYANHSKQPTYVPRVSKLDVTLPGYIDLAETQRVTLSAGKGKIKKLSDAGLIQVLSYTAADLGAPAPYAAQLNVGAITILGYFMSSLSPGTSTVLVTGTGGPLTLTQAQIITAGGTVYSDGTEIDIPASLVPGVASGTTSVRVIADGLTSNPLALV